MLELAFVALMQGVAGEPAAAAQAPDSAATAPQNDPTTTEEPANPRDRVRCRRVPVTGSRVETIRVCSTPRQDEHRTEGDRAIFDRMLNHQNGAYPMKPGG